MTLDPDVDMNTVAECFRASMPSDDEVRRAQRRFARFGLGARRSGPRMLVLALVQGFVIGVTTLATAAFIGDRIVAPRSEPRSVPPAPSVPRRAPSAPSPRVAPYAVESKVMESPVASPAPPAEAKRSAAAMPRLEPPAQSTVLPSPTTPAATEPVPPVSDSEAGGLGRRDGPWAIVATALEHGDRATADHALKELSSSSDGLTRDAAELTRAQIWIAGGNGESFRSTLVRLSQYGQTPLIRRRAAELLGRLNHATN